MEDWWLSVVWTLWSKQDRLAFTSLLLSGKRPGALSLCRSAWVKTNTDSELWCDMQASSTTIRLLLSISHIYCTHARSHPHTLSDSHSGQTKIVYEGQFPIHPLDWILILEAAFFHFTCRVQLHRWNTVLNKCSVVLRTDSFLDSK